MKILGLLTGAFLALMGAFGPVSTASAATYNVGFVGTTDHTADFTAMIMTDVSNVVTSITGLVNGFDTITGVIPTGAAGYTATWTYDDKVVGTAPYVDNQGLLWKTAFGKTMNLYSIGTDLYVSYLPTVIGGNYDPGVKGKLTVTSAVPLPATGILFIIVLAGLFFFGRRSNKGGPLNLA